MPLISCPNAGCRKTFKYRIERKRHLDGNRCMVILQESTKREKPIIKKGDVFVCLLCNAEIKHRNNKSRHKKTCKKQPRQTISTCNVCSKQFSYKSKIERHSQIHARTIFSCNNCMKRFKRDDHPKNHKCSTGDAQLPTMVVTNCIQSVSDLQFQSIPDNASVSNIISDTYFEFSDFVPELVPDDLDDEDIDNAALAHDTVSVPDVSTLTDHSAIVLDNAIAPTAFTNDTVFSSEYISVLPSDVVSRDTNLPFDDQEVPQCETLPCRRQNRMANIIKEKYLTLILC